MAEPTLRDLLLPSGGDEEGVERLAAEVQEMLARARLQREEASDPRAQLAALAPRWLGRMAAVAAIVALTALLWPARGDKGTSGTALDRWVLSGTAPEQDDPVLGALLR